MSKYYIVSELANYKAMCIQNYSYFIIVVSLVVHVCYIKFI